MLVKMFLVNMSIIRCYATKNHNHNLSDVEVTCVRKEG